ncbi:hypothetical protein CLV60_1101, partial [Dyadobacter jiangsuensis]
MRVTQKQKPFFYYVERGLFCIFNYDIRNTWAR